jgi:peroxiredoxin
MPNDLTGDFDVVAEFAIPAVNRVLAAMHMHERFPHSLTVRVDDNPPPGSRFDRPSVVGLIDIFGDAVTNHHRVPDRIPISGLLGSPSAADPFDPVVNLDTAGMNVAPLVPSRLQGRAQVQLGPPTIELTPSSTSITVRLQMMCRYFPDPQTPPAAEFVRGELRVTAAVNQTDSLVANVVTIDLRSDTAQISFTPQWSSRQLSAEDRAGIDLLMRNALKSSFLPSNIPLPSNIAHARFKSLLGPQGVVALMLDMDGAAGNPATVQNVFLGSGNDFGFAVGAEFVLAAFQPTVTRILSTAVDPVSFKLDTLVHTFHITYTITLTDAALDLQNGKMVLTITGHAHTDSWTPSFNFTVRQEFSLGVDGDTADLIVGHISLDTTSWIVDRFRGAAIPAMERLRDAVLAQSNARGMVRDMLSADANLGAILRSLLTPGRGMPTRDHRPSRFAYTSAEIRPSGFVLRGTFSVTPWPPARVEYEPIPSNNQGAGVYPIDGAVPHEQDYSALKSWIPGGTIRSFEWKSEGQSGPGFIDENRFVFIRESPGSLETADSSDVATGYSPLCLTVRGNRLSSSGTVIAESVTATVCGYRRFPLVSGLGVIAEESLLVALTRSDPDGMVEVVGHTAAQAGDASAVPNLIVHFAGAGNALDASVLSRALAESGRRDAAAAILVVSGPGELGGTRFSPGVTYAEDADGSWRRQFGVAATRNPVTLIVAPGGKVVWRHDGEIDAGVMAETLGKHLAKRQPVTTSMVPLNARIGQPPPNFLFETAPGAELTLRKIGGRSSTLVFWRSASKASIQAIRDAQESDGRHDALVLAINDGESPELAKRAAGQESLTATIVTDPRRQISRAYGVTIWPTIIGVDAFGVVRTIGFGRIHGDAAATSTAQNAGSNRRTAK